MEDICGDETTVHPCSAALALLVQTYLRNGRERQQPHSTAHKSCCRSSLELRWPAPTPARYCHHSMSQDMPFEEKRAGVRQERRTRGQRRVATAGSQRHCASCSTLASPISFFHLHLSISADLIRSPYESRTLKGETAALSLSSAALLTLSHCCPPLRKFLPGPHPSFDHRTQWTAP
jgi:hypothetical protein